MHAGMFTYAWDLEAEGYDRVVGEMAENGITHINLATSYHAGKFLLPHNPRHRTYFAEDGSLYFRPDLKRYGQMKPRINSLVRPSNDPVSFLQDSARKHGIQYVAWVVLMHNSWLGTHYPDMTVHTAFGDPLIHSLNPTHPAVQEYVLTMLSDLVSRHDVAALKIEAPGYMAYSHGWHHEFGGVALDPVQERLLSISFSPHEIAAAGELGIDAVKVRDAVAELLDHSWNEGFTLSQDNVHHPAADSLLADSDVVSYQSWQANEVVSLAKAIRKTVKAANHATEIRHIAALDGAYSDAALLDTGDGVLTGYATSDHDAKARVEAVASLGKNVYGMVRAIPPDTTVRGQITRRVETFRSSGVAGIDSITMVSCRVTTSRNSMAHCSLPNTDTADSGDGVWPPMEAGMGLDAAATPPQPAAPFLEHTLQFIRIGQRGPKTGSTSR